MGQTLDSTITKITERIRQRSRDSREAYLKMLDDYPESTPRGRLSCSNLAHVIAAENDQAKDRLAALQPPNLAIINAYNDMLSAHQPLGMYPPLIKEAAFAAGATAQVAGGVPAMCDGVTQGQPGMELSLFSREVIAMATAVSLSHGVYDAALLLGVCDKIVPGLLIGALSFGHLPCLVAPAGPMPSGISNKEKALARQRYAKGEIDRAELLQVESQSYHSPGTCTFYGTANSNQMLLEFMGLMLPGGAFVNPDQPLRHHLTQGAATQALRLLRSGDCYRPIGHIINEFTVVNGVIGLLATGGSTNHMLHLPAIARAAGIQITLDDIAELSSRVPLLARVYPNGQADVNHFHAAGGLGLVIHELLEAGLLHEDVPTVMGSGLRAYTQEPYLDQDNNLNWREGARHSLDRGIISSVSDPFEQEGGIRLLSGNLGRAIIKVSAVAREHRVVRAPARVFDSQEAFLEAFGAGQLDGDMVAVVRFQGPAANGMPELHKLTPALGVLQDRGHQVALLTDGRMSGASGKVPAAIHLTPEALHDGWLARIEDGDMIVINAESGVVQAELDENQLRQRPVATPPAASNSYGRNLFQVFRDRVSGAEDGASACL
ncbi:MAG: phosphogluconate dehydratase [Wenzhouxiangellaceae bacterium]